MGGRGSSGGGGGGGAKLPQLTGSEKQVSWASDIRSKVFQHFDYLDRTFDDFAKRVPNDKNFAEDSLQYTKKDVATVRAQATDIFKQVTSASAIIDKRLAFTPSKMEELVKDNYRKRKKR